ncbi:Dps family protein [Domibacillus aminovorans]|uniref:DNA starvation/stationary phase protection protein n=1 Tax=Domibacillus aminovorans TaxID=29332 RepID=A0A177KSG6_9BACI|nr:Dps family protein [Domibacillus aminovorans]OAH56278.1 DNA starvation/stationary phase protection protein [Domibacillus aminovorans]OAH62575.1 DNA starvation/stationary phase protection protein [Domibacillus aminovorans]
MAKKLTSSVNKQIANWTILYTKLHNYHWYVKGHQFFTLHAKFEELYTEASLHIDELAERLLALDGKPIATLRESLDKATVKEAEGKESAEEMVKSIIDDFSTMTAELKEAMDLADEVGDETTGDMLLAIHQSLEQHIWMLKSFLGK